MALRMLRTLTRRSGILDLAGRTLLVRTADVAVSVERVAAGDLSALDDVTLSLRRLISAMAAYQRVFPSRVWKRLMDDATSLVRPTAELREIETRRQWILSLRDAAPEQALPGIEALLRELEIRERELTSFFERALHRFRTAETLDRMAQIVSSTTGVTSQAEAESSDETGIGPEGGEADAAVRAAAEELIDALGTEDARAAGDEALDAVAGEALSVLGHDIASGHSAAEARGDTSEPAEQDEADTSGDAVGSSILSVPGLVGFPLLEQAAQVVSWQVRFFEAALSAFLEQGPDSAEDSGAEDRSEGASDESRRAGEDEADSGGAEDGSGRGLQIPDLGSLVRRVQDAVDLFSPVFGARLRRAAEEVGGLGSILDDLNTTEGLDDWLEDQLEGVGARDPRAAGICYVLADVRARRDAAMQRLANEWTPVRVQRIRELLTDAST